jgi:hypothetical protein
VLLCLPILLNCSTVKAQEQTREETILLINQYADTCFGKPYFVVLEKQTLTININQKKRVNKELFINKCMDFLKELENIKAKIFIKEEYANVVKQTMLQEGIASIKSYYKIKEEISCMEVDLYFAKENFYRTLYRCNK